MDDLYRMRNDDKDKIAELGKEGCTYDAADHQEPDYHHHYLAQFRSVFSLAAVAI